jgi:hypothetical protein
VTCHVCGDPTKGLVVVTICPYTEGHPALLCLACARTVRLLIAALDALPGLN